MENAVKHNAVSKETALTVDVYVENGNRLVLRNNINKKYRNSPVPVWVYKILLTATNC